MALNAANNAETKLATAVDESAFEIVVEDASVLPEAPFVITIGEEILVAHSVTDNTLSVFRGWEGTTASSHDAGSKVQNKFTAGMWNEANEEIDVLKRHSVNKLNPHGVTAEQIGLGNVDNVQQASKADFNAHIANKGAHGLKDEKVEIGLVAQSLGDKSIAIGIQPMAMEGNAIAIGENVIAWKPGAIAIGSGNHAEGWNAISIGGAARGDSATSLNGYASGKEATALGNGSDASADQAVAIGVWSSALNPNEGVLGSNVATGTNAWKIPGSLRVTGTKNFEIPHPNPVKKDTHVLRHAAVESPTAGDNLYRYTVEAKEDGQTVELQLPDYFEHLNKDVDVWVSPSEHFGRAYGKVVGDKLLVTCETAGEYKVLVIGTRNDENVQDWDIKGVEREIGESWLGETYVFEQKEIIEVQEIKEEVE